MIIPMMTKAGILIESFGKEYLVTVNEPLLDGSPMLIVSQRTKEGWDSSYVPPMDVLRAKALAINTISRFHSALQAQLD